MFLEIKFNPLTAQLLHNTGIDATASSNDSTTTLTINADDHTCMLCPPTSPPFVNRPALLGHLVLNHRLPFCAQCACVLPTEQARMTHENSRHWPHRCAHCRREFFQLHQLEEHQRSAHRRRTCDLCEAVCEWTAEEARDDASSSAYDRHLRLQHQCGSAAFDLAIAAPVCSDGGGGGAAMETISKFSCRLCKGQKLFANFYGHYLNYHKVRLNKFLALALQFVQSNEEFLGRIRVSKTIAATATAANGKATSTGNKTSPGANKSSFDQIADNFTISLRECSELVAVPVVDFDSSLVQFVASTDGETSSDDADGEVESVDEAGDSLPSKSTTTPIIPHRRRRRRHACPFCATAQRFDLVGLGRHMHGAHGFQVRNFEYRCHRCRKSFASRESLQRHNQRVHYDDQSRDSTAAGWSCPFCDDADGSELLNSRTEFRMHVRQHVDRHDYPCPPGAASTYYCRHCADQFWTVDQLNAHQTARHHMQLSAGELLLCRHCGITSSSKQFLRVHCAEAHASLTQCDGRFVFKCAVCLVACNGLEEAREHMRLMHAAAEAEFCAVAQCRARLGERAAKREKEEETDEVVAGATATETKPSSLPEHVIAQHADMLQYTCRVCEHQVLSKHGALKHFIVKHKPN